MLIELQQAVMYTLAQKTRHVGESADVLNDFRGSHSFRAATSAEPCLDRTPTRENLKPYRSFCSPIILVYSAFEE